MNWTRAFLHYGRTRRADDPAQRDDLLYSLLDAVTTPDPRFDAAYRFDAIFLAEPYPDGASRPGPAVKLLKKGVRARPERWQYPPPVETGAAAGR